MYSCCHGYGTYVSLTIKKTKVNAVNLLAANFGDRRIKGFRENGKSNTGIKTCVQPP